MMDRTPFVIVDLETTGLQAALDKIIEVAVVRVVNNEIVDEWDTTVNPGIFVSHESTQITGITSEMLEDSPRFEDVAEELLRFIGHDSVFVAHNVDFDRAFLNYHLDKEDFPVMENPYLCTFKLTKKLHPHLAKYGLSSLSEVFGIDLPQAHRALHDARATAQLFMRLNEKLAQQGILHPKDIPTIQNIPLTWKEAALEGQGSLF